jgi:hypothetical protein
MTIMQRTISFAVKNRASRYVALDLKEKSRVIAEGRTAVSVAEKARKTGRAFSMMFIPAQGKTYVY